MTETCAPIAAPHFNASPMQSIRGPGVLWRELPKQLGRAVEGGARLIEAAGLKGQAALRLQSPSQLPKIIRVRGFLLEDGLRPLQQFRCEPGSIENAYVEHSQGNFTVGQR